jgi:phenylpyruvate tautomerase PptA (4-oxalocrotonate tautomerase family)
MPIVDIKLVLRKDASPRPRLARAIADAVGAALHLPPGRVWVRVSAIAEQDYAENGTSEAETDTPVFVSVLHAVLPPQPALQTEASVLASTIAGVVGTGANLVHIEYAPPGKGRIAFGGILLE